MASNEVNNNGRNYLDDLMIYGFVIGLMVYLYIVYYIDVWYFMKSNFYYMMSLIPEEHLKYLFWSFGYSELSHMMHVDLVAHASDYGSYYRYDTVGQRKKSEIDIAMMSVLWPVFISLFAIKILTIPRSKKSRILNPVLNPSNARGQMYAYASVMQDIFPYIKPVVSKMAFFSTVEDLDEGYYANPKLPLTWVIQQKICTTIEPVHKQRSLFMISERKKFILDKDKAYGALKEQLGPSWTSINDLNFIEKCVLMIFTAQIFGNIGESRILNRTILNRLDAVREIMGHKDTKGKPIKSTKTKELLGVISDAQKKYEKYFSPQFFDMSELAEPFDDFVTESLKKVSTKEILRERGAKLIASVLLKHRYNKTIFLALMDRCWMYGVLSASELLWVKEFQRDLYFIFSQQGRRACFIEVAGPWAHYLAEKSHGYRMLNPQMLEAVRGIDEDLYKTHENYISIGDWSDTARMRRLVPDLDDGATTNPASAQTTMAERGRTAFGSGA